MALNDLFELCHTLAPSQGFYGRLLHQLNAMDDEQLREVDIAIRDANLQTSLDLILWLES